MGVPASRDNGWVVAGAATVGVVFASQPIVTFSVFLLPVAETFSWSRQMAASAYSTMMLLTAVSAPLVGMVLDHVGARRVVAPCLLLSGLTVISLSALTDRLWHVYAAFAVIGIATVGASPIAYSRVIFSWFDRYRGRALALTLAGAGVSGSVLAPLAQSLIRAAGWRVAWLTLGSMTVAIGVPIVALLVREGPLTLRRDAAEPAQQVVRRALGSRVFWTLTIVVFGSTVATTGAGVHLAALLTDRGVLPARAAFVVSTLAASNLAGRLLAGWLIDRFAAARVACALLTMAAAGMLRLAEAQTFVHGLVAAVLIGIGAGGEFDIAPYLLGRHFGLRSISTLYGFIWMAVGAAGTFGPILLGRAYDATGTYAPLLIWMAAIILAAGLLMLTLPAPARPVPAPTVPTA
ncbi:MAG TPA: MFS transporter [Vicinamibacterales bacterium]|nr:MFS transporter [Vicinamibacterales bacterium]